MNPYSALVEQALSLLKKRRERAVDHVVSGQCKDFADYKKYTGMIKGFDDAAADLGAVVKAYLVSDDDFMFEEEDEDEPAERPIGVRG